MIACCQRTQRRQSLNIDINKYIALREVRYKNFMWSVVKNFGLLVKYRFSDDTSRAAFPPIVFHGQHTEPLLMCTPSSLAPGQTQLQAASSGTHLPDRNYQLTQL